MADLVPKATAHLRSQDLEFFARWMLATALEDRESASQGTLKDLWCKNAAQRELQGMGIASLTLDNVAETRGMYRYERNHCNRTDLEIIDLIAKRFLFKLFRSRHTFKRDSEKPLPFAFTPGDSVMVSSEAELALAQGVVVLADRARVVVALDKDLGVNQKGRKEN
jgi:hypothetical protein